MSSSSDNPLVRFAAFWWALGVFALFGFILLVVKLFTGSGEKPNALEEAAAAKRYEVRATVKAAQDAAFQYKEVEKGKVVQVRNAPITLQNVVTYDVVIAVENPELLLKPGRTATVSITTARQDDVVRVPLRALRFRPEDAPPPEADATVVWRVADADRLESVSIETGLRNDRWAELASGDLAPDAAVVVALERDTGDESTPAVSPFQPQRRR